MLRPYQPLHVPFSTVYAGACALHPQPVGAAPCTPAGAIALLPGGRRIAGLCRRVRPAPAAGGRCPLHPRWGHFISICHYRLLRAMQARAPCTRSRWALPPAPPLGPFHFYLPLPPAAGSAGACALHPQQAGAAPCTPAGAVSLPQTP
jgi:hypothetical protein